MTDKEFKEKKDNAMSQLFVEHKVFFAFSSEQFEEGKKKHPEVKGWGNLFGGGICPKDKVKGFYEALNNHTSHFINLEKKIKTKEDIILDSLYNYECFYTHDLEEIIKLMADYGFTETDVWKVFEGNQKE